MLLTLESRSLDLSVVVSGVLGSGDLPLKYLLVVDAEAQVLLNSSIT